MRTVLFTGYHHKNVVWARVTPVVVPGREFHSDTKYSNGIMRNVCDFESYVYFINMKGRVLGTPHGQTRELL